MKLHVALGLSMMFTRGSVEETVAALTRGIDIARQIGDTEYSLRGLWGLWVGRLNNGAIPEALKTAQAFAELAPRSRDPLDPAIGERMVGFSLHFHGEPRAARAPIERMLARNPGPTRHAHVFRFQFDQWATARGALAEVLWLLGLPEQAMRAAEESVADAAGLDHAVTLCNTLAKSAAVMLLAGDLGAARTMIDRLRALAATHALSFWRAEGGCLEGLWHLRSGDLATGLGVLRKELFDFPGTTLTVRYIGFLGELANALSLAGEFPRAQATIDEALHRAARNEEQWCFAELLRIKAEIVLRETPDRIAEAEALLARSLDFAVERGALAWELRTTASLARLLAARPGGAVEARDRLAEVYGRFTEGFATRDLLDAKSLLDTLTAATG